MQINNTLLTVWILIFTTTATWSQSEFKRKTKLPPALKEVSGMVQTQDGALWLHNDSNNPSELFRYDPQKKAVAEIRTLPVKNRDWEDITTDGKDLLFIGDFGNNANKRTDLRVFIYNYKTQLLDSIRFRYPDQKAFPPAKSEDWNFNCEAFVFYKDSLHLFSKNVFHGNFITKHYVIPAKSGQYVATLRDSICLPGRVVTGAALSQDGKTLALTSYIIGKRFKVLPYTKCSVFFISDFQPGYLLRGKIIRKKLPKFLIARQYESITHWKGEKWLVANEGRKPQYQAIWRVKKK